MKWIKQKLVKWLVGSADPCALNDIVFSVKKRYSQLYADEEVVLLSLPTHDREERLRIIRAVLAMELNHP